MIITPDTMLVTQDTLIDIFTVLGTAAFALSAVFAAKGRQSDIFTIVVLGLITAVGGGTIRDTLLDVPIFWAQDLSYIWIACAASLLGFAFIGLLKRRWLNRIYLYIDAVAIAMFAIQGTDKAWSMGFGLPVAPVILGIITAVGGGIVRDVLLQRPSLLMNKELYAIPVALGCILHATVRALAPDYSHFGALAAITLVIYLRHLSISHNLQVPGWALLKTQ